MFTSNVVVTPPATEPVSLAQLKSHLRVDHDSDDALIVIYGQTARMAAERYMNRALIETGFLATWQPQSNRPYWGRIGMWHWRKPLELPRSPLMSIDTVTIHDVEGNATTVPPAAYLLEGATDPARLKLDYTTGLIDPVAALLDIQIGYTAGYGSTAAPVPVTIINAILITTAFLYEHRGDGDAELPKAAEWLLDMDRVMYFGG